MIAAYREQIYDLTGYRITQSPSPSNPSVPLLKLRSMYAESPDDYLLFQPAKIKGSYDLLESEYAKTLDDMTLRYYKQFKSVPAMLAHITFSLFEKNTFAG